MFTGIVEDLGTVTGVEPSAAGRRLTVAAGDVLRGLEVGDSIAVNGVCLTAVVVEGGRFTVDVVHESLARSNLGDLAAGARVDLERPLAAGGRLDGHIVQGHVDGVGTVASVTAEGDSMRMRVSVPAVLGRYLVEKGSVAVDGVSLTVTAVAPVGDAGQWFEVALIPHTLDVTVLGHRHPGDRVNLEVDVLAKYVERLMEGRS